MARLPPIDLKELLELLRIEGKGELRAACGSKLGGMGLMREWDNILVALDSIITELAKGAEIKKLVSPIKTLGKSAAALSALASCLSVRSPAAASFAFSAGLSHSLPMQGQRVKSRDKGPICVSL